jgi:hypothetical protein
MKPVIIGAVGCNQYDLIQSFLKKFSCAGGTENETFPHNTVVYTGH